MTYPSDNQEFEQLPLPEPPPAPRRRERMYPCLKCGRLITPSRATYLFSISHNRNVGPFHSGCANTFTESEEDHLWANADTLLSRAETYGPTGASELVS